MLTTTKTEIATIPDPAIGVLQPDDTNAHLTALFQKAVRKRRNGAPLEPIECQASTFWGDKMTVLVPEPVSEAIILNGYAEEGLTSMILSYLAPGMTFVDVGAHLGFYSLLASHIVGPAGAVHAFEPGKYTYSVLTANTLSAPNISTCNAAVHSKAGTLELMDFGPCHSAFNSFYAPRLPGREAQRLTPTRYSVNTLTFDAYVRSEGCVPDFIKIDAESSEYYIIEGMRETLQNHRPIFTLEVGDQDLEGIPSSKDLIAFGVSFGYKAIEYRAGRLAPHQTRERYSYDNILFLPQEDLNA